MTSRGLKTSSVPVHRKKYPERKFYISSITSTEFSRYIRCIKTDEKFFLPSELHKIPGFLYNVMIIFHDGDCKYIPGSSYHGLVHCVTYIVLKQGYRSLLSSQCYLLSNRRIDKNTVAIYIKKEVKNYTVNCVTKARERSALSPFKHDYP